MKSIASPFRLFLLAAAASLTLVGPAAADATLRKCNVPPGSTLRPDDGPPFLMIDGVVVGDIEANAGPDGEFWYSTPEGKAIVTKDQIEYIVITCVEHEVNGQRVARAAISVGTKGGSEGMLRRYLTELVELQEGHRQATGAYASTAGDVRFWLTRHPIALEMNLLDGGWTAKAAVTNASRRVCSVAVGTATATGAASGEVECFDRT